jgi:hypothetical protein
MHNDDDTKNRFPRIAPPDTCGCDSEEDEDSYDPEEDESSMYLGGVVDLIGGLAHVATVIADLRVKATTKCHTDLDAAQVSLAKEIARLAKMFDEDEEVIVPPTKN